MSLAAVRAHLAQAVPELVIVETEGRSASVAEAAMQHGVAPGQIAKTLAFAAAGRALLVAAGGDRRIDNPKMKAAFGGKAHMPAPERVRELTGHAVGGVCPFGLATPRRCRCTAACCCATGTGCPPAARCGCRRHGWRGWRSWPRPIGIDVCHKA